MFMQKIRHATYKHRTVLIVVVVLLAIGLVGSFAVWGAADSPSANTDDLTTMEQIELYESYIAQTLPAEGEEITYDTAGTVAALYMNLYSLYATAYNETVNDDADLADEYYNQSIASAVSAAEYYQLQLDNATENTTDYEKAGVMGNKAMALACSEDNEAAQTGFDEALALAPNNYDLAVNYLSFVYNTEGLEAAQAYAASYMELVGEESSFYSQMQSQIDYIEQYEEMLQQIYQELENLQNENQSTDGANTDGESGTTGDGSAEDNTSSANDTTDNTSADDSAN